MTDIYLVAGESSGDLQGAHLLEALYSQSPHLTIAAVAGPRMRAYPIHCATPMEELQVMGFIDVVKAAPRLYRLFRKIRNEILQKQPKAVICIDYPGFNIRLERSLRKHGYRGKLIHYICPTVWAWGKKRIPTMANNLDLLLSIFPFEKNCFAQTDLTVEYVGHPLVKKIREHTPLENFKKTYRINPSKKILSIFPGSRQTEVERNFPIQLQAARRLLANADDFEIAVSLAHPSLRYHLTMPNIRLIEPQHNYDLMQNSFLAIATSGTVTLELSLFQVPTVVNFAITPLDQFIAQKILRINLPHYAIVNILAKKTVFPELFGSYLTVDALERTARQFLDNETARLQCRMQCAEIQDTLGHGNAAANAASQILAVIKKSFLI